jgi:hypothetical protein
MGIWVSMVEGVEKHFEGDVWGFDSWYFFP